MKLSEAIRLGAMMHGQYFRGLMNTEGTAALHPFERYKSRVGDLIRNLNDKHKWTREAIADWVATIEAQQPTEELAPPLVPIYTEELETA